MTFYQSCLGGQLTIIRVADTPIKDQAAPEHQKKVAFAYLRSGGIELSATDWRRPTRRFNPGNTVGVYLSSDESAD